MAAALAPDESGAIERLTLVVSTLGSRPRVVAGLDRVVVGRMLEEVVDEVARLAFRQCHPLENIIVEPEWRRAMVPVYTRRILARLG